MIKDSCRAYNKTYLEIPGRN